MNTEELKIHLRQQIIKEALDSGVFTDGDIPTPVEIVQIEAIVDRFMEKGQVLNDRMLKRFKKSYNKYQAPEPPTPERSTSTMPETWKAQFQEGLSEIVRDLTKKDEQAIDSLLECDDEDDRRTARECRLALSVLLEVQELVNNIDIEA